MEASKLHNVIADLIREDNAEISSVLNNLISYIQTNDSENIIKSETQLKALFELSYVNSYSPSNVQILHEIGGDRFYGKNAMSEINSILNSNVHNIKKTIDDLTTFVQERTTFVELVESTRTIFKTLKIPVYYHQDETFEVGILIPEQVTDNKINVITKELNKWDKVFKTFKELCGEEIDDTKISLLSNGSLQFFIDNGPVVALCLTTVLERVAKLYKTVIEIRSTKMRLKELGIDAVEKSIDKQEKENFNLELTKIGADIFKQFAAKGLDSGRSNELKVAVKGQVTYIAKCIDSGIIVEITPPELEEPEILKEEETSENKSIRKEAKLNYEKTLKQIEVIKESMEIVKSLGNTGIDIMNYLGTGEQDSDQE